MKMNQPLSSLNLPTDLIKKLESTGFRYCNEVKENLESINPNLNISSWSSVMEAPKPKTALELCQEEEKFKVLSTPISKLDPIFRSVIFPGCVTEFCGLPGSGKTQICLNLVVGMKGEVVFIHTNKNLNPDRLREISLDKKIFEKMLCIKAESPTELLASVQYLEYWLPEHDVRMVLIDSISWPLKQQELDRSSLVGTLFQKLRIVANKHNLSIVITNDLTTRIAGDKSYYTSCFGDSFYHLVNNRVLLTKQGTVYKAEILKSVSGYHSAVSFQI